MTAAQDSRERLRSAKRVVVKIGSALLVDPESGRLHRKWLAGLADDVAVMKGRGQEVLIVSSGAIALGVRHLGLGRQRLTLERSQAAAAVGQIRLAHAYEETLARHRITVAQILLTPGDTEERRRYLNARSTLASLLALGVVPVINENDTVATSEIRFGDNDRLAARVAQMVSADCLVLLSDVDGFYDADPDANSDARLIPEVRALTPEIEAMAGRPKKTGVGSGGMVTKIAAARIALSAGCRMAIIGGAPIRPIARFEESGRGTWFLPDGITPQRARKQWIGGALNPSGTIVIDDGAAAALARGGSLLPAGVADVRGSFERGDAVIVETAKGREVARGLAAYGATDARAIMGHKSDEIEARLGYRGRDEMIHRDDLVLTRRTDSGRPDNKGNG